MMKSAGTGKPDEQAVVEKAEVGVCQTLRSICPLGKIIANKLS